ncbi:MAG: hypothetical protein ACYS9X_02490 [Planctomycetota bacterium]|jgi:hypothetical protein
MRRGYLITLVATVVVAVVLGSVLPALLSEREINPRRKCVSNLKQILYSCQLYSGDYNDDFPPTLGALFPEYLNDGQVFLCPSSGKAEEIGVADLPEGVTDASAVWSKRFTDYVYVEGLRACAPPDAVVAYGREGDHEDDRFVAFIGGMVTWRHEEEFRAALAATEAWIREHPRRKSAVEDDRF